MPMIAFPQRNDQASRSVSDGFVVMRSYRRHRRMRRDARADEPTRQADLVGVMLDSELLDVGKALIERPLSQKPSSNSRCSVSD